MPQSTPLKLSQGTLSRLLLLLVLFGATGLLAELSLMEHWGEWRQTLAVGLLFAALPVTAAFLRRPGEPTRRLFLIVMALLLVSGLIGTAFHFLGNFAFERELAPDRSRLEAIWMALQGATPTLAPGAMVQLALLGWIAAATAPSRPS